MENEEIKETVVETFSFDERGCDLIEDFEDYQDRKKNEKTTTNYGGGYYMNGVWMPGNRTYNNCCPDVDFYEWSDINRKPISFRFVNDFKKFMDEHDIVYTQEQMDSLRSSNAKRYGGCKKGTNILNLAYSESVLEEYLKDDDYWEYNSKVKVDERNSQKALPVVSTPSNCYNGSYGNHSQQWWSEWD